MNCRDIKSVKSIIVKNLTAIKKLIGNLTFNKSVYNYAELCDKRDSELFHVKNLLDVAEEIISWEGAIQVYNELSTWDFFSKLAPTDSKVNAIRKAFRDLCDEIGSCLRFWESKATGEIAVSAGLPPGFGKKIGNFLGGRRRSQKKRRSLKKRRSFRCSRRA